MTRKECAYVLVLALIVTSSGGCLFVHNSKNIIRQTEPRQAVQFESREGATLFQKHALDEEARVATATSWSVGIPFVLWYSRSKELSENAYYNDQVAVADVDNDGRISDDEVMAFDQQNTGDVFGVMERQGDEIRTADYVRFQNPKSAVRPASAQKSQEGRATIGWSNARQADGDDAP